MLTIIGNNVKRIISERNIKQKDAAALCGYSAKTFSNMLNGYLAIRDTDIVNIKHGLDVEYNELFKNASLKALAQGERA